MLIDISRALDQTTPVYPGDVPFSSEWSMSIAQGGYCNVSTVRASSHAGTHVDLPRHLSDGGEPPPLEAFCGPCMVIELGQTPALSPGLRVLIKGERAIEEETVRWLVDSKAVLVGVETMSVDPVDDESLANHHVLMDSGITILESLDLGDVPVGEYELIALPLKIPNADATWVRAVLRK